MENMKEYKGAQITLEEVNNKWKYAIKFNKPVFDTAYKCFTDKEISCEEDFTSKEKALNEAIKKIDTIVLKGEVFDLLEKPEKMLTPELLKTIDNTIPIGILCIKTCVDIGKMREAIYELLDENTIEFPKIDRDISQYLKKEKSDTNSGFGKKELHKYLDIDGHFLLALVKSLQF